MRRGICSVVLLTTLMASSGCALTESVSTLTHAAKRTFRFRGTDVVNPADLEDEAWITEAAEEARGDLPRERDPDQWWKKYMMSERARSIERNLGFD